MPSFVDKQRMLPSQTNKSGFLMTNGKQALWTAGQLITAAVQVFTGAKTFSDPVTFNGGIFLEAKTVPALNSPWGWMAESGNGGFWKDPFGIVHFQGRFARSTGVGWADGETVFTMPVGYRPAAVVCLAGYGFQSGVGPAIISLFFNPSGAVTFRSAGIPAYADCHFTGFYRV